MHNDLTVSSVFNSEALDRIELILEESDHATTFLGRVDELVGESRYFNDLPNTIEFTEAFTVGDDGLNASILYDSVGNIDRSNAADPRLWSFLSMITLRDYMMSRWPIVNAPSFKNKVNDHWLLTTSSSRRMMRNGAGRLWWTAHLTYDPDLRYKLSASTGDPFAYTKWVLANENRRQSIFERRLGRSPKLRWAVLEAMADVQAESTKDNSKALLKKVHLHTGYQRLEALPEEELRSLISQLLQEVSN